MAPAYGLDLRNWATRVLFLLAAQASLATAICWNIDGFEDAHLRVCDPTAAVSSCCATTDVCYSNGLCGVVPSAHPNATFFTAFFIGGCTRQDFDDEACGVAPLCRREGNVGGWGVTNCGGRNYCCYGVDGCGSGCPFEDACDCSGIGNVFSLPPGSILTTLPAATASDTPGSVTSTAFLTPDTTANTASQRAELPSTIGTTPPSSTANDATGQTDGLPGGAGQSQSETGSTSLSTGAKAGIGVACGAVGLIAFAVAAWLYRRRTRRRIKASRPGTAPEVLPSSAAWKTHYGGSETISELNSEKPPRELHGSESNLRGELEGDVMHVQRT